MLSILQKIPMDKLIDFLIDSNMCVLNGLNFVKNDFTPVSIKGCAVVDYCIIHHDNIYLFQDFKVKRSTHI